jgi:hypothetical protein
MLRTSSKFEFVGLDTDSLELLHVLCLSSVRIPSKKLLSTFEQCGETLSRLQFVTALLNSGTVQDILTRIGRVSSLLFFKIASIGYTRTGWSSHLCPSILEPWANPEFIEIGGFLDYNVLGHIQRQVNHNRSLAQLP